MNQAHLHMVFNHFPIIGMFFGIGILLFGLVKKQTILINTAYVIFIICMIFGKATMMTGEGAEEIVEKLNISHDIIHEHEETAETFMKILYVIGLLSIIGIFNNLKEKFNKNIIAVIVLIFGFIGVFFAKQTGTTGGEIRHTEIRNESNLSVDNKNNENEGDNDED